MELKTQNNFERVNLLDSFRAIAIIAVLLYHFFYRWNSGFVLSKFFHYGFKGVSFFFIISGFVIYNTLEKTPSILIFFKKRFVRLFPSLFFASTITYLIISCFDDKNLFLDSHSVYNYIISLTFIPPKVFNILYQRGEVFGYLNYSYWSLWVEVQFYLFIGIIYYFSDYKKYFINVFLIILLISTKVAVIFESILFTKITTLLNLPLYLHYFLMGVVFCEMYNIKMSKFPIKNKHIFTLFLLFSYALFPFSKVEFIFIVVSYALFLSFIYLPKALSFLENKIFFKIGISSYFLYLIHEYIGALLIKKSIPFFPPYLDFLPLLVIIFFIIISYFYTFTFENKLISFLWVLLNKSKNK